LWVDKYRAGSAATGSVFIVPQRWAVHNVHERIQRDPSRGLKLNAFMQIRSILLPTDFSECGNFARSYAASLARKFGASIIAVHVIEPMVPTVGYSGMTEPLPIADIADQLETSAERELPRIAECEECAGLDIEEVIVHGEAAAEIVRVAKDRNADLIVLSSHGRTGLGRILFGSTAEAVVRHASCPVLVVKPAKAGETS
jgi:nucleotide-binding universal stress UspA family protein